MSKGNFSRREFLRIVGGTMAGAALAGCAGPQATEAPTQPAEEGGGGGEAMEVEFWDWAHEPRVEYMETIVQEFEEENPNVNLNYNPLGWTDIETKLLTAATAGTGPAMSNVHYFWRYDLQRAGVLSPYPSDIFDFDKLISTPFNRDPETGEIYTCDFNFYCDQVYYNRELLEAEGIDEEDIPANWDDFIAMAQQLTKTDGSGNVTQVGCSLNDYWAQEWLWHTLIYQQGGWLYNEAGNEAIWNEEAGVRALQFISDWYHEHQIDDPDFLAQPDAFGNAQAAMYINQGYTAAGINAEFPQMEGKWGTAPTPTFTGEAEPAWGMAVPEEGFCVFNTFDPQIQEASFDYIEFMLGSDTRRLDWADVMDGPPDREDLLDHPLIDEMDVGQVIDTQARTLPWRVIYGERPLEAEKFWRTMFEQVILENADPQTVLDTATEQMNAAFAESDEQRIIVERNYSPPS